MIEGACTTSRLTVWLVSGHINKCKSMAFKKSCSDQAWKGWSGTGLLNNLLPNVAYEFIYGIQFSKFQILWRKIYGFYIFWPTRILRATTKRSNQKFVQSISKFKWWTTPKKGSTIYSRQPPKVLTIYSPGDWGGNTSFRNQSEVNLKLGNRINYWNRWSFTYNMIWW